MLTFATAATFAALAALTAAPAATRASQAATTPGDDLIFSASVSGLRSRLEVMSTVDLTVRFPAMQAGIRP